MEDLRRPIALEAELIEKMVTTGKSMRKTGMFGSHGTKVFKENGFEARFRTCWRQYAGTSGSTVRSEVCDVVGSSPRPFFPSSFGVRISDRGALAVVQDL